MKGRFGFIDRPNILPRDDLVSGTSDPFGIVTQDVKNRQLLTAAQSKAPKKPQESTNAGFPSVVLVH
jgi:hypothetical protein